MPRLFSAIDLGPAARDGIAAEQHRLAAAFPGASLRWVRPEHLHLTLVFMGEVADECVAPLVSAMQEKIDRRPFRFELGGFGVFPPRGAPRALWLGVQTGVENLVAVHQAIVSRCERLAVPLDPRPFHPHLTLARWRDRRKPAFALRRSTERRPDKSERPLDLQSSRDVVAVVDVRMITLFHSRLSSEGPTYRVLAESPLSGVESALH